MRFRRSALLWRPRLPSFGWCTAIFHRDMLDGHVFTNELTNDVCMQTPPVLYKILDLDFLVFFVPL